MFAILTTGIIMAVVAALFWCLEAKGYIDAVRAVELGRGPLKHLMYSSKVLGYTPKLIPLALDLVVTVWLTGTFGFTGMIGSVIGLSISNVISIFIMYYSRPKK